jgi:hypothetical protein
MQLEDLTEQSHELLKVVLSSVEQPDENATTATNYSWQTKLTLAAKLKESCSHQHRHMKRRRSDIFPMPLLTELIQNGNRILQIFRP